MKGALFIIAFVACQPPPSAGHDAAVEPATPASACTMLGAPCTFAPGKLGTCVEVEQVNGPSAFVCQSQH